MFLVLHCQMLCLFTSLFRASVAIKRILSSIRCGTSVNFVRCLIPQDPFVPGGVISRESTSYRQIVDCVSPSPNISSQIRSAPRSYTEKRPFAIVSELCLEKEQDSRGG